MSETLPEFSRVFNVDRIRAAGGDEALEAKPAERTALAERFGLVDLPVLKATLSMRAAPRDAVAVKGTIEADVVQTCVVTLEPVASHLDIPVDLIFVPQNLQNEGAGAPYLEDETQDFEYFAGGRIDLGEIVAQNVGINLDPYPRKPDAALPAASFGPADEGKPQPFAVLAQVLKNKE